MLREEEPPFSVAFLAISASSLTLLLLSSLSSPSFIKSSTALLTSSLFTNTPFCPSSTPLSGTSTPTLTPIFSTCTANFSLENWSAKSGHVISGTPLLIASSVEFQPQCVRKPPTAGCDSIITCGAQPHITRPLPLVLSSNPVSEIHFSISFDLSPPLTTQINGRLDASKPKPSSISCEVGIFGRLPRQA
ncbi:hypothetical protein MANES_01G120601v8 [Manihot esculenta]|uniref:Uncharacterized protein n=1 Tax=Manihot esculenta TaxID=3983 RepID=A0ACB7IC95_MANES|nr:hypothetical protein MANES_01G120601v8 [Manihot esculenta]